MSVISSTPPPSRTVATADATLASRSSARSEPDLGAVEFDEAPLGAHRAHQRGLADAGGPGHQHAEIRLGAQGFEQLRLVEGELEPFGEPAGLGVGALEVVDRDRRVV